MNLEDLHQRFDYDPGTGLFTHRRKRGFRGGEPAGWYDRKGYLRVGTGSGHQYFAHRLAWLWVHGDWPIMEIDHINGIRDDNRIANLREATRSQNLANAGRLPSNTSGFKGVSFSKSVQRWHATITIGGKQKHLGYHDTAAEAHAAYLTAAKTAFGDFSRAA